MEAFLKHIELYKLDVLAVEDHNDIFEIEGVGKFLLLDDSKEILFDNNFSLILSSYELNADVDFYCYEFGGKFYYTEASKYNEPILKQFRFLGKADVKNKTDFCHLGVHGGYELLNGSGLYKEWVSKTVFYGYSSLGICEYNTLGGTLPFQIACKESNIKPIIGETVKVNKNNSYFDLKLYVKNSNGWLNLLAINKEINVINDRYVTFDKIIENSADLYCVLSADFNIDEKDTISALLGAFGELYYQIDVTIWRNEKRDSEALLALKKYFESNLRRTIKPILLNDSYYLNKDEAIIKELLNKVGEIKGQYSSDDQYYKHLDDVEEILLPLFSDIDKYNQFFNEIVENANVIRDNCDFVIDTTHFRLPKYEMTEEEKGIYNSNDELLEYLMTSGLIRKCSNITKEELDIYESRLEEEIRVISLGGFVDYFLILWDLMQWCKQQGILRGIGRGSAAGCLISYLLDITEADPIKYDLIFERFLNESRIKSGLPDIDCDFPGERRDDVKKYMEQRYGINYVASIGTYTTLKIKMALKDIGRAYGLDFKQINIINSFLDKDVDGKTWQDLLKASVNDEVLLKFLKQNTEFINSIQICLNQPRSSSIHASAVIIVPKENENGEPRDIYQWLPVKKVGDLLVSEWEHAFVEKSGFLKEDILGIAQLDKFTNILNLIEKNHGKKIDIYTEIPLDDIEVYNLFHLGLNEDVFQFGSDSQKVYSKKVKPDNIEHLNAMNALYRPGPMDVGAHEDFAMIKNGLKEPVYNWGTREVLSDTFGLIVYQEQTMKIAQVLADFTMTEADGLRRALTKKGKGHEAENFRLTFINRCIEKGCNEDEAHEIWHKLEAFTAYGFNRSHSLSYAITGYICQWFKLNYPLEFWVTSLQFSKENEIYKKISEIEHLRKLGYNINLLPPEINKSIEHFYPDLQSGNIYWSLNKIKYLGEEASKVILGDRMKNGNYYSFEEFYKRVPKAKVNKRVISNLIYSGAFDEVENISNITQRRLLFEQYCTLSKSKIEKEFPFNSQMRTKHWWMIKQKEACGLGNIDYESLLLSNGFEGIVINEKNVFTEDFSQRPNSRHNKQSKNKRQFENDRGEVQYNNQPDCCIGGVIISASEKGKEKKFLELKIDCNSEIVICTIWNDTYMKNQELKDCIGDVVLISGVISFNDYKGQNTIKTHDESKVLILKEKDNGKEN